jgi:hypothetical protein
LIRSVRLYGRQHEAGRQGAIVNATSREASRAVFRPGLHANPEEYGPGGRPSRWTWPYEVCGFAVSVHLIAGNGFNAVNHCLSRIVDDLVVMASW